MPDSFIRFFLCAMNQKVLLSTAYFAPIQYYSKLLKYKQVFIEVYDNFNKQTYRNRCKIYGANGVLQLSIPVKKTNPKTLVKDIYIDYDTNWRKMHWKSIESAYKSSPYFEFYEDELSPFFEKKTKFLIDLNSELQSVILNMLDESIKINYTNDFIWIGDSEFDDFREKIHPKKEIEDQDFASEEYNQVFIEKHGFIPNLSILDLLFNEGPNAINFLI